MRSNKLAPVLAVVGGAIVLVVALIIGSQLGGSSDKPNPADIRAGSVNEMLSGIPQDGIALGNPEAKVTIVEFADPQCPFCADWGREVFPSIVDRYVRNGKVRFEYRGLRFLDDESGTGDSDRQLGLSLAAGRQDKLWNVVGIEYENQGTENSGYATDAFMRAIAGAVDDLDAQKAFDSWNSDANNRQADENTQLAEDRLGRLSTPSFLIGQTGTEITERVEDISVEGMTAAIDAELAK